MMQVLDEVQKIMRYVRTNSCLGRAYKVTDELFDLSTMAMEYFKERLEPTLPEITKFSTDFLEDLSSFPSKRFEYNLGKVYDGHAKIGPGYPTLDVSPA
jgi:hypothetical protein